VFGINPNLFTGKPAFFSFLKNPKRGFIPALPLQTSLPKRPVRRPQGIFMFGSLAIGDGNTPNIFGSRAIISDLLFQPPDGSRATGSSIVAAGSGSKATGVIEHQDCGLIVQPFSLTLRLVVEWETPAR
jgi:hypothetical protein